MKLTSIVCSVMSAALCCALFGLVGCAGDTQEESDVQQAEIVTIDAAPIEIIQSGFSVGSEGAVSYAFTMSNPNDGYVADRVTFSISGYDAEGNMVMGAAESMEKMYPGIEYAIAGSSFLAGTSNLEWIEITPSMDLVGWMKTDISTDAIAGMFSVVNPRTGRLADESVSIGGRVVANNLDTIAAVENVAADAIRAKVCAILVDPEGNFVAGGTATDLVFNEEESAVHKSENVGSDAATDDQAAQESADGSVLKAASFSISVQDSPGFKECRYFVMPS